MKLIRLRVQHIDLERDIVTVRAGKGRMGGKDRVTVLRDGLKAPLAAHLLRLRELFESVQELLGHAQVETTMIYTHVPNKPGVSVKSPFDRL